MPRSFLKIYFDFDEKTDELSDAEKGRLLLAMYRYALTGEKPTLTGNERFLFSTFKGEIDRDIAVYNTKITNGNMGGRKPDETEPNRKEPEETENNLNAQETRNNVSNETNMCAVGFEIFWGNYPRHTNKQAAYKAFAKLNPDDDLLCTILAAIEQQKKSEQWTKDGGQFIPHPATWLNGRRWEDEMPRAVLLTHHHAKNTKTVSAQNYQQRDYTEDELLAVGDDLIAEARARRQA